MVSFEPVTIAKRARGQGTGVVRESPQGLTGTLSGGTGLALTYSNGDLAIGLTPSTNRWPAVNYSMRRLPLGPAGQVLTSTGTDAAWAPVTSGHISLYENFIVSVMPTLLPNPIPHAIPLSGLLTGILMNTNGTGIPTALANSSGSSGDVLTLGGSPLAPSWVTQLPIVSLPQSFIIIEPNITVITTPNAIALSSLSTGILMNTLNVGIPTVLANSSGSSGLVLTLDDSLSNPIPNWLQFGDEVPPLPPKLILAVPNTSTTIPTPGAIALSQISSGILMNTFVTGIPTVIENSGTSGDVLTLGGSPLTPSWATAEGVSSLPQSFILAVPNTSTAILTPNAIALSSMLSGILMNTPQSVSTPTVLASEDGVSGYVLTLVAGAGGLLVPFWAENEAVQSLPETFIVSTSSASLPNAIPLSGLSTGILMNTISAGDGAGVPTALANSSGALGDVLALSGFPLVPSWATRGAVLSLPETFIVSIPSPSLPAAIALSGLSTGILMNTTTSGVPTVLADSSGVIGDVLTMVSYTGPPPSQAPSWELNGAGLSLPETFIVSTPSPSLPNAIALSLLSTGILVNTEVNSAFVPAVIANPVYSGYILALTSAGVDTSSPSWIPNPQSFSLPQPFIVSTSSVSLPAAIALSGLSTGILMNTTTSGVPTVLANSSGSIGQVLTLDGDPLVPQWTTASSTRNFVAYTDSSTPPGGAEGNGYIVPYDWPANPPVITSRYGGAMMIEGVLNWCPSDALPSSGPNNARLDLMVYRRIPPHPFPTLYYVAILASFNQVLDDFTTICTPLNYIVSETNAGEEYKFFIRAHANPTEFRRAIWINCPNWSGWGAGGNPAWIPPVPLITSTISVREVPVG